MCVIAVVFSPILKKTKISLYFAVTFDLKYRPKLIENCCSIIYQGFVLARYRDWDIDLDNKALSTELYQK